jgi:hypothetical protein
MAKRDCSQKSDEVPQTVESHLVASGREVGCDLLVYIVHMLSFILCASLFRCHDFYYRVTTSILEWEAVAAAALPSISLYAVTTPSPSRTGMDFSQCGSASTFFVSSRKLLFITSSSTGLGSLKTLQQHCLTQESSISCLVTCCLRTWFGNESDIPSRPRA